MSETPGNSAPDLSFVQIDRANLGEYQKVHDIRAVFTQEYGATQEENATDDDKCDIYLLYDGTQPVATARANYVQGKGVCICRIAVPPQLQGKGLGQFVVRKLIDLYLPTLKPNENIFLGSFMKTISYYEKLGFVKSGDVYVDENQFPLQPMIYKP